MGIQEGAVAQPLGIVGGGVHLGLWHSVRVENILPDIPETVDC